MQLLSDDLYNIADKLYLRRDDLKRMIETLQREQLNIYHDMNEHDTYMLYSDLEAMLSEVIEDIEELEYQIGNLELMELDFKEYKELSLEELKDLAGNYNIKKTGTKLELITKMLNKIYNW